MSDQQQAPGGGELTQFEELSAVIPKKQPLAILIGACVLIIAFFIINALAPTEAVEELRGKTGAKEAAAAAATPTSVGPADGIDDI